MYLCYSVWASPYLSLAPTNRTHIKAPGMRNIHLWKVGKQVQPGLTAIDSHTEWNYTVEATEQPDLSVSWRSSDCRDAAETTSAPFYVFSILLLLVWFSFFMRIIWALLEDAKNKNSTAAAATNTHILKQRRDCTVFTHHIAYTHIWCYVAWQHSGCWCSNLESELQLSVSLLFYSPIRAAFCQSWEVFLWWDNKCVPAVSGRASLLSVSWKQFSLSSMLLAAFLYLVVLFEFAVHFYVLLCFQYLQLFL